ncbi:MAG: bifunctional 5,10-methylene-tetrahydrofolate dehydrogenase/5,10-methylene-tetrahydrofolate cyclohydrolase [Dehalococcoidia bacterium]|nr:bifunctional 5,10-methylene-tetrahydrofolate dehydrogenase/5,10-methylene-tetrahydrofolate cyclohydrolase [Dehalococcoidia bacterium]
MSARIISGTETAKQISEELKNEVAELKATRNIVPGLATVIVGCDGPSLTYVGNKVTMCEKLNMRPERHDLPADISEKELLALIACLNADPAVHGLLVQLPLPKHICETRVLMAISPLKDVDGLHPVNVGKVMIGEDGFLPCTPAGIHELLLRAEVAMEGAEVVVVGRSNIVGKPLASLLMQKRPGANATVTICHSQTRDLKQHTLRADVLIAAIGRPRCITADMVREGTVVIDVGTNEVGKTAEGKRILVGDVDFEAVKEKAAVITPVPGGVGPMTIIMLMKNTLKAAKLALGA